MSTKPQRARQKEEMFLTSAIVISAAAGIILFRFGASTHRILFWWAGIAVLCVTIAVAIVAIIVGKNRRSSWLNWMLVYTVIGLSVSLASLLANYLVAITHLEIVWFLSMAIFTVILLAGAFKLDKSMRWQRKAREQGQQASR